MREYTLKNSMDTKANAAGKSARKLSSLFSNAIYRVKNRAKRIKINPIGKSNAFLKRTPILIPFLAYN